MSYHDVYITTANIPKTRLFDLPFGYELTCNRVGGWTLWFEDEVRASEYGEADEWLVIEVNDALVLDSRK